MCLIKKTLELEQSWRDHILRLDAKVIYWDEVEVMKNRKPRAKM